MKPLRQAVLGIAAALLSLTILLGGLAIAMTEGNIKLAQAPTAAPTLSPIPSATSLPARPSPSPLSGVPLATATVASPSAPAETTTPVLSQTTTPTPSQTVRPTFTNTLPPSPTVCPSPPGWFPITIQPGDTLDSLAETYGTTTEELAAGNCLITESLVPGTILYVPNLPPTHTPVPCGPPSGWVFYTVQSGDTLYHIAQMFGTSVAELQLANCLGSSVLIHVGQKLYVPNVPPKITPTRPRPPTRTPAPTATPVPTDTPVPPTAVPTTEVPPSPTPPTPPTPVKPPEITAPPPTDTPTPVSNTLAPPLLDFSPLSISPIVPARGYH